MPIDIIPAWLIEELEKLRKEQLDNQRPRLEIPLMPDRRPEKDASDIPEDDDGRVSFVL